MKQLYKHSSHEIKGLDEGKGVVIAYANTYGNEDSDGDISMPGSFKKTVQEQSSKMRVFKDHNRFKLLGVPLEIDADDPKGLLTRTKFNMDKQLSKDMFTDIKLIVENGQDADLSVGVIPTKRSDEDKRKVLEWKLLEYSFLSSWGANDQATVQQIKTEKDYRTFIEMLTKAYDLDYSDQRLQKIEGLLKALEAENTHFEPREDAGADNDHSEDELITNLHKQLIT